jgi:hypothetical protein
MPLRWKRETERWKKNNSAPKQITISSNTSSSYAEMVLVRISTGKSALLSSAFRGFPRYLQQNSDLLKWNAIRLWYTLENYVIFVNVIFFIHFKEHVGLANLCCSKRFDDKK